MSLFDPVAEEWQREQGQSVLSLFEPSVDQAVDQFSQVGLSEENLRNYQIPIYNQAPPAPANQPRPVIVFAPGFGTDRDLYVGQIAALVGAGYLVVTVGATYETLFTVFPDGEVVLQSERCSTPPKTSPTSLACVN